MNVFHGSACMRVYHGSVAYVRLWCVLQCSVPEDTLSTRWTLSTRGKYTLSTEQLMSTVQTLDN